VKPSNRNPDTTTLARAASIITGRSRIARRMTSGGMAVVRVMNREMQQRVAKMVMASGWKWEWEIGCG